MDFRKKTGNGRKLSKEQKVKEIFCKASMKCFCLVDFHKMWIQQKKNLKEKLHCVILEFTEKELEKFRTLVLQVHYGYEVISEQDVQFARDEYDKLVKATVRQMKFRKKSVFYIWKGF